MQHFHAVKRTQAPGDLLDDVAHRLDVRLRIVDHPLRQRLPVNIFRDGINEVPFTRRRDRLQHVGVVDAPRDPLLHQEAFEIRRVRSKIDRRGLDDDLGIRLTVDGQVNMTSAARMHLPDNSKSVENHPRVHRRRKGKFGKLPVGLGGIRFRQGVDPDDLYGQVIVASIVVCLSDDGLRRVFQIVGASGDFFYHGARADMLIYAVRRKQEDVAHFHGLDYVVELHVRIDSQSAAEIAFMSRNPEPMVFGELLQRAVS